MTDEQQPPDGISMWELAGIHTLCATLMTIFFRWQGADNNFWHAGDESLVAQGFSAAVDMLYWFMKPRITKWRNV